MFTNETIPCNIHLVLERRLKDLNDELRRNNEEKARLELELSKGSNAPPAVFKGLPREKGASF